MAGQVLGRHRLQARLDEAKDVLQRAAQGPGRIHPLDGKRLLLAIDPHGDLLGILLRESVDQNFRHVPLQEIQCAHQHAPGIEPGLVEVLIVHVVQRLGEYLGLRQFVGRTVRVNRSGQGGVGDQLYVITTVLDGEKQGEGAGGQKDDCLA